MFLFIYFSCLEIGPWLREFRAKNAVDFSQLTFDPGQKELVVGARWEIWRFALADIFNFILRLCSYTWASLPELMSAK